MLESEIAFADGCLGQLVAALRASGRGEDTLLAVIGDHGEGLGDHGESTHGIFLYESTLHVPLVLTALGGARHPAVIDAPARSVDLAPTLLTLAHLPLPARLDGASLAPLLGGGREEQLRPAYSESMFGHLHFGWAELRALTEGPTKFVAAPRPEIYDLAHDAGEEHDLASGQPAEVERLRGRLDDLVAGMGPPLTGSAPDAEAVEKLAALGYLGGGGASATATGADPKDTIGVAEALVDSRRLIDKGNRAEGIARLRELIADEPNFPDARFLLGFALMEEKPPAAAEARTEFGRVLALNPRYPLASYQLGLALVKTGDPKGALAAFDAAIALDPRHGEALAQRADLLGSTGRLDEALASYRKAIALSPEVSILHAKVGGLLLRMHDFTGAESELREAVKLNPKVPVAHYNLALLAEQGGRVEDAVAEYRAAIAADPDDIKPLVNLAALLRASGQAQEAIALLRKAIEIDPGFAPAREMLARAERDVGGARAR